MVILEVIYAVFRYNLEYVWYSIKWLWTRESPGNYLLGIVFVIGGISAYHNTLSAIEHLLKCSPQDMKNMEDEK